MKRKKFLHPWTGTELLGAEIADRFLSAVMKWSRKEFSDKELLDHILFSTLSSLVGFSAGSQLKQIGPLLKKVAVRIR
jgi:hypothetical protein